MKKLMLTAAAAALAGGAFATNIFDYKASVKYVDLKTVTAKADTDNAKHKIFVKVVKSATLKGYLVTPEPCACNTIAGGACRFGNEPGFLVVKNSAADKYSKSLGFASTVKVMPANLLTEWWATTSIDGLKKNCDLQAQGYLFAGVGKRDVPDPVASPYYGLGDFGIPFAADDEKCRTAATQCLFGQYNILDSDIFIEPFLDQAGFGKAKYTYKGGVVKGETNPCIFDPDQPWQKTAICLTSLSGTLIGGSFLCLPNGVYTYGSQLIDAWTYPEAYLCQGWDDHVENASTAAGTNCIAQDFGDGTAYLYNVICGTWSIKANTKIVSQCNTYDDVNQVGVKLDKNFDLNTFDSTSKAALNKYAGEFVRKWF